MIRIFYKTPRDTETNELNKPKDGSWVVATKPTHDELAELTKQLDLDLDTLKDALDPYEAPRIARDEEDVYIFTRYCHPENPVSATEPLLILVTKNQLITVSPYAVDFIGQLSNKLATPTTKTVKLLLQIFEAQNETYASYLDTVTRLTLRTRTQLSKSEFTNKDFLKMIDAEEDLNEMLTTLQSYAMTLEMLFAEKIFILSPDEKELLEDIRLRASELIELTRSRLRSVENIREVYNTITSASLNETFKRLTSIAIFMTIPTIIGGLYGMNVQLPAGDSPYAFIGVMGIILLLVFIAIIIFRKKKWL